MNFSHSGDPLHLKGDKATFGTLVFFINKEDEIVSALTPRDRTLTKAVNSVLENQHLGKGNFSLAKSSLVGTAEPVSLILIRCKSASLTRDEFRTMANSVSKSLSVSSLANIHMDVSAIEVQDQSIEDALQYFTVQTVKAGYRFQEFKSKKKAAAKAKKLSFHIGEAKIAPALKQGKAIGEGISLTRDLGNRPGNHCTPTHLAEEAIELGEKSKNLSTTIHEEAEMQELGMGSFLSVTAGSDQPAKLIEMNYQGAGDDSAPFVLIGKGITFDTGGISMKPPGSMDEMKFDMCGAATVFGVMKAVAKLQLPINLVGLVAAAENMPGGDATKPGDIVTSMSGKTIEVLNTDAEGRLVLCDTLSFAQRFNPSLMIDVATLTGACIVALGSHASALYSNDEELACGLLQAGQTTGDRLWRMPLWKEYTKQLDSNFADLANIGGPKAGSVTAACFLQEFVGKTPWAHLDIAGTAWLQGARKGATGRPVEMIMQFLLDQLD